MELAFYLTFYTEIRGDSQVIAEHELWQLLFSSPQTGWSTCQQKDCNPFWFWVRTALGKKGKPSSGAGYVLATAAESFFAQKD